MIAAAAAAAAAASGGRPEKDALKVPLHPFGTLRALSLEPRDGPEGRARAIARSSAPSAATVAMSVGTVLVQRERLRGTMRHVVLDGAQRLRGLCVARLLQPPLFVCLGEHLQSCRRDGKDERRGWIGTSDG